MHICKNMKISITWQLFSTRSLVFQPFHAQSQLPRHVVRFQLLSLWTKSYGVTIQMKPVRHYIYMRYHSFFNILQNEIWDFSFGTLGSYGAERLTMAFRCLKYFKFYKAILNKNSTVSSCNVQSDTLLFSLSLSQFIFLFMLFSSILSTSHISLPFSIT